MRTELVLTCPVCQKPLWVISLLITENDVNLVDKQRKAHTCSISIRPNPNPNPNPRPLVTQVLSAVKNDDLFGL